MKKGQITVFIILGIFIISIIGLTLYLRTNQSVGDPSKPNFVVETFVQECLDQSFEEALINISQQGGYFYQNQENSIVDFDVKTIQHNNTPVQVILSKPKNVLLDEFYPCQNTNNFTQTIECHKNYDHTKTIKIGLIGNGPARYTPELCNERGTGAEYQGFVCDCSRCKYTIQEQLENVIRNKTISCLSELEPLNKLGYDITSADLSVKVQFGNQNSRAMMDFNLSVSDGKITENFNNIISELPARTKPIYFDIILKSIFNEATKIDHDLIAQMRVRSKELPSIDFIRERIEGTGDSIITLVDQQNIIGGSPYKFSIGIENRKPAIDYFSIKKDNFDLGNCDIYKSVGSKITIEPQAYDPDEDPLWIDYSGWKADEFESSDIYTTTGCKSDQQNKTVTEYCAETTALNEDVGIHELTITANDPYGNQDYQTIKICIINDIIPSLDLRSLYSDVDPRWISVEDPYFINVSSNEPFAQYKYKDVTGGLGESDYQRDVFQFFDRSIHDQPEDIPLGIHQIDFAVSKLGNTESEVSQSEGREVKACLPHRNQGVAPFPYNDISWYPNDNRESDPYFADHTCCDIEGNIKNSDTTTGEEIFSCFKQLDYGNIMQLNARPFPITNYEFIEHPAVPNGITDVDETMILRRDINHLCGTRGNLCDGDLTATITFVKKCGPCEEVKYGFDTCQPKTTGTFCGDLACSTEEQYQILEGTGDFFASGTCDGFGNCNPDFDGRIYCVGSNCQSNQEYTDWDTCPST